METDGATFLPRAAPREAALPRAAPREAATMVVAAAGRWRAMPPHPAPARRSWRSALASIPRTDVLKTRRAGARASA
jgi:hypothetical protein